MIGGVVIEVYIIVVQGKTVRPRTTIVRVEDNEVDYLFLWHPNLRKRLLVLVNSWAVATRVGVATARQRPLRTPEDQERLQGLWRLQHLRTPEVEENVQGLSRASARERLN